MTLSPHASLGVAAALTLGLATAPRLQAAPRHLAAAGRPVGVILSKTLRKHEVHT